MNPQVVVKTEEDNSLKFTLSEANVSIANALRRTILSNIPTIGFKTFPEEENDCEILVNSTRFTNEIIKHRLSQIPVHITDTSIPLEQYLVIVKKKNDSDSIQYVTTEDFKIINTQNKQELSQGDRNKIFPSNTITGDYIDFVRLRPKLSAELEGEELSLTCKLKLVTAKEDAVYNVVSTCSYGNTQDPIKANDVWVEKAKELVKSGMSKEAIEYEKKNFGLLEALRYYKPDSFDFIVETLGIYTNDQIIKKACDVLVGNFKIIREKLDTDTITIKPSITTIEFSHDIVLEGYDYTEGKVIEYLLYTLHYLGDKTLSYCGFRKDHPHNNESYIRIAFKAETEKTIIKEYLRNVLDEAVRIFTALSEQF